MRYCQDSASQSEPRRFGFSLGGRPALSRSILAVGMDAGCYFCLRTYGESPFLPSLHMSGGGGGALLQAGIVSLGDMGVIRPDQAWQSRLSGPFDPLQDYCKACNFVASVIIGLGG
jgi:hypothetical protein